MFELSIWLLVAVLVCIVAWLTWHAGYVDALRRGWHAALERVGAGDVDNALGRMWPLWLLFAACFGVVLLLNSAKAGLAVWGIGKVALAGPVGYLISYCTTARKDRPEALADGIALGTALKCRNWIICATIIAIAFGVP